jgi:2Fe-2S ferredoxin
MNSSNPASTAQISWRPRSVDTAANPRARRERVPRITVLPHSDCAPGGASIDVAAGTSICDALLEKGIDIEHACGKVGACTTCHVVVREGFGSLAQASEDEEDMLDRAWGVEALSRLSCQAIVADTDLTVEIPRYTLNLVKENG